MRSFRVAGTALVAMWMSLAAGCSEAESAEAPPGATAGPAVQVSVAPVKLGAAQRFVETFGTLHGDEETTLSAKVSGRVVAIYHDIGDRVQPDQPLAQIERRDYELTRSQKQLAMRESLAKLGLDRMPEGNLDPQAIPTIRKAKLAAENAEARFLRGKQLHDQQPPRLSDQEFADLQTTWEVAQNEYQVQVLASEATLAEARARQAELEMADQQLADATIRAPSAQPDSPTTAPASPASTSPREYSIAQRLISLGEYVREGTPLFRLIDDDPIKLRASIPERFIDEVRVDQTVRVRIDAFDDTFMGRIARINPQIDPATRNFVIEAIIPNSDHRLRAGAFARAAIESRVDQDVILVPHSAVVTFAGVNRVFIVEDGLAVERRVELGERRGDEVEIRSGLAADSMLVISGAARLSPGTPVTVR